MRCEMIHHKGKLFILINQEPLYGGRSFSKIGNPLLIDDIVAGAEILRGATNMLQLEPEPAKNNRNQISKPIARNTSAIVKNDKSEIYKEDDYTPISCLNTNLQSWVICARLEIMGPIRTFTKKNSEEGSICNCIFADNSGKINMCFWKSEQEKFFGNLHEGQIYIISGGEVKVANPKFNRTTHSCDITCSRTTVIDSADNVPWLQKFQINLKNLSVIPEASSKQGLTLAAIISAPGEKTTIQKRDGDSLDKTSIYIYDHSGTTVEIIAWGNAGDSLLDFKQGDIVIITNLLIQQY